jgi:hypothetical protein
MLRFTLACLWFGIAAAGVLLTGGCASIKNPELRQACLAVPAAERARVYPIFLNSQNDPLGFTNFRALADFAEACGFCNTRYHHFDDGRSLAKEVRAILREHPGARICLIGWSGASLYAFDAAGFLAPENITLDEIIYLDSNWVKERRLNSQAHPANVSRVALLYSANRTAPLNVPHPAVFRIPTPNHSDVATHPRTAEIVIGELLRLAQRGDDAPGD